MHSISTDSLDVPGGATLLVAVVDAFVGASGGRGARETRQFVELFDQLLPAADVFTRAVVAQRLAPYSETPLSVLIRLASDEDFAVAEPVLAHAARLPEALVDALARGADIVIRRILARRRDLTDAQALALAADADPVILAHLGARVLALKPMATIGETAPAPVAGVAAPRFLAGDRGERASLLAEAVTIAGPPPGSITPEGLAILVRRLDLVASELSARAGLRAELLSLLFDDEGGEPLVVVLRHVGLGEEAMAQVMARCAPQVGEVVDQMFRLRALFRSLSAEAAATMIAVMREEWSPVPKHQPQVAPGRAVAAPAEQRAGVRAPFASAVNQ